MITICALGSGSSGNCFYIGNGKSALLLDAGFSGKEIISRLKARGLDPSAIGGVVVSHEHVDHVRGAGIMARMLDTPLYVNEKTYLAVKNEMGRIEEVIHFQTGAVFDARGFEITPFSVPHDAADPCGFVFGRDGVSVAVVTDAGVSTMLIEEKIREVDYMVLEANHDPSMLMAGPYPWPVKQRIASREGHMSNEACAELLGNVRHAGLQGVTFAHVSETNNNRELVRQMAEDALGGAGVPFDIASQGSPGAVINVE